MSQTLMFFYSFHAALIKCAQKCSNGVHPFKGEQFIVFFFLLLKDAVADNIMPFI